MDAKRNDDPMKEDLVRWQWILEQERWEVARPDPHGGENGPLAPGWRIPNGSLLRRGR